MFPLYSRLHAVIFRFFFFEIYVNSELQAKGPSGKTAQHKTATVLNMEWGVYRAGDTDEDHTPQHGWDLFPGSYGSGQATCPPKQVPPNSIKCQIKTVPVNAQISDVDENDQIKSD